MDELIDTITRTSIFSGLSREDLARVAGKLDEVRVAAGTTIIRQGEPGDSLYVVQTGAVEVLHRDPAGDVERMGGAVVWHLPTPAPLDAIGMRFLATLTVAVVLWSINVFDDFVVALGLLLSWIVAGIVRPEVALSGFTKASWFLFVGALGLGAGVTRSGLLYRAALAMARRVTPSYPRYTAILVVAGLLATPALPSMISRMAVVAPVSWAIAESVGFAPRSPGAAGIVLSAFLGFSLLGFSLLGFMFLTGSTSQTR